MKIFKVRVESHSIEKFTIRAENQEKAKAIAEGMTDGSNLSLSDSRILSEEEDDGQNVDNE